MQRNRRYLAAALLLAWGCELATPDNDPAPRGFEKASEAEATQSQERDEEACFDLNWCDVDEQVALLFCTPEQAEGKGLNPADDAQAPPMAVIAAIAESPDLVPDDACLLSLKADGEQWVMKTLERSGRVKSSPIDAAGEILAPEQDPDESVDSPSEDPEGSI